MTFRPLPTPFQPPSNPCSFQPPYPLGACAPLGRGAAPWLWPGLAARDCPGQRCSCDGGGGGTRAFDRGARRAKLGRDLLRGFGGLILRTRKVAVCTTARCFLPPVVDVPDQQFPRLGRQVPAAKLVALDPFKRGVSVGSGPHGGQPLLWAGRDYQVGIHVIAESQVATHDPLAKLFVRPDLTAPHFEARCLGMPPTRAGATAGTGRGEAKGRAISPDRLGRNPGTIIIHPPPRVEGLERGRRLATAFTVGSCFTVDAVLRTRCALGDVMK